MKRKERKPSFGLSSGKRKDVIKVFFIFPNSLLTSAAPLSRASNLHTRQITKKYFGHLELVSTVLWFVGTFTRQNVNGARGWLTGSWHLFFSIDFEKIPFPFYLRARKRWKPTPLTFPLLKCLPPLLQTNADCSRLRDERKERETDSFTNSTPLPLVSSSSLPASSY